MTVSCFIYISCFDLHSKPACLVIFSLINEEAEVEESKVTYQRIYGSQASEPVLEHIWLFGFGPNCLYLFPSSGKVDRRAGVWGVNSD